MSRQARHDSSRLDVSTYRVPIQIKAIPSRISSRSNSFALMFLSLKMTTPHMNEIITELRRTSETTEIIDPASLSEVKYAKSPIHINMDINGIDHLQLNGVPLCLVGYQISPHMTDIMIIW